MPVPGSQVVAIRPLRTHEERWHRGALSGEPFDDEPIEDRWSRAAALRFVAASGLLLWTAIGLLIDAVL